MLLLFGNLQLLPLRLEILALHRNLGLLFNVVAFLAAHFDLLRQQGEPLRVKGVLRIQVVAAGLIQAGERHTFQFEAVFQQVLGHRHLHLLHKIDALFVQLLHGHLRGDGAECVDELAFHQFFQVLRLHGALPKCLGRIGNGLLGRLHADVKFRLDVSPHAIVGDQCLFVDPLHLEPQGVHVHGNGVMHDRQDQSAAVEHHPLTAQSGTDKGDFFGRALVQTRHHRPNDE